MARPELLAATLDSLSRCDPPPAQVIVVDGDRDRSAAEVVERARAQAGATELVYAATAPSATAQRNHGIDRADGDVVVFLDDDVTLEPGALAALARAYRSPAVLGATGRIHEGTGRRFGNDRSWVRRLLLGRGQGTMTSFGYPRRLHDPTRERAVEFMQGAFMSVRREALAGERFDESLGGYALYEDEDLSYRLSRKGVLLYVPDAVVHHHNTGFRTIDRREFNRKVVVNRAYVFRKNFAQTWRARGGFVGLLLVLAAHRVANGEWDGLRGLADGVGELRRGPA